MRLRVLARPPGKAAAPEPARLVAYDLETTSIEPGTPRPVYLTAYGPGLRLSTPVDNMAHLADLVATHFLTDELAGASFVAWNANRFDAFFVAAALLLDDRFVSVPYMTQSKSLRGLRVIPREDAGKRTRNGRAWTFADGMAMLGLQGVSLARFTATFAPDYAKLAGVIDWSREAFDATNPLHRAYAERDAEGLWHAMDRAQSIMLTEFRQPLRLTIGATGIRVLQSELPPGVQVRQLPEDAEPIVRDELLRGGFVHCPARYDGAVWKYDLNQAYAHAMRAGPLPAGACSRVNRLPAHARVYMAQVSAELRDPRVPIYVKARDPMGRIRAQLATRLDRVWLTSPEIEQLKAEGVKVQVHQAYVWSRAFNLQAYVDRLERVRTTCEGGPSGPIGTVVKAVGNNSYGKTAEQLDGTDYVIAEHCPDGYVPEGTDDGSDLPFVWWRFSPQSPDRPWHQPQLAAFVTAIVRMQVRRAALLAPDAFVYADTDCVIYSRDLTDQLDIDPGRYGAWKIEEQGAPYLLIAKKVYVRRDGSKASAKGMNVRRLGLADFEAWHAGREPIQDQVQLQNFLRVLKGAEMYRAQTRRGTRVTLSQPAPRETR